MSGKKLNDHWVTDWSGVVSDDRALVYMVNLAYFVQFDLYFDTYDEWLSNSKANVVDYMTSKGLDDSKEVREKLKDMHGDIIGYLKGSNMRPFLNPGVKEFFKSLKEEEKIITVVSCHPHGDLEEEMERYGIEEMIDNFVGSCDSKVGVLREVCKDYKIKPERTPYCGDMVHDVEAAKEAGMVPVAISTGYHSKEMLREAEPDILAENMEELREELAKYKEDFLETAPS